MATRWVVAAVVVAVAAAAWLAGCGAGRMTWIVDRVEGATAVLVDDDGRVKAVPLAQLPRGAAEGAALVDNRFDDEEPQWRRRQIAARRARLSANDDARDFSLELRR